LSGGTGHARQGLLFVGGTFKSMIVALSLLYIVVAPQLDDSAVDVNQLPSERKPLFLICYTLRNEKITLKTRTPGWFRTAVLLNRSC